MTRRLLLPALIALAASPALAGGDKAVPVGRPVPGFPGAGAPGPPGGFNAGKPAPRPGNTVGGSVAPPHPSGAAVIELLEDDAGRLARALHSGGDLEKQSRAGA